MKQSAQCLVDDPSWITEFISQHEFAERGREREEEIYGSVRLARVSAPAAQKAKAPSVPRPVNISELGPLLTLKETAAVLRITLRAAEAKLYRDELPVSSKRVGKRGRRILRDELFERYGIGVKHGKKTR